jgi:Domain of unknown function (DUF4384)
MRYHNLPYKSIALIVGAACALIASNSIAALAQKNNPLFQGKPVAVTRQPKHKPHRKKVVQTVHLLKLEWRVYKVKDDGSQEETSPLAVFHVGDRLRLSVETNQNGFLYIVHQAAPTAPGQIIYPDSRLNGGRNDVAKGMELLLPSNCPPNINSRDCSLVVNPPAGQELFTIVFTRDPITDLPSSASEASGGIPPEKLMKLKSDSGQVLRRQKGSTPLSVLVINTNTKDNEDIFETLVLNKGQ